MSVTTEQSAAPFVPKDRTLTVLQEAVQLCRGCDLYQNATQSVFGELEAGAKAKPKVAIMMIGEQPGDQEDKQGRPLSVLRGDCSISVSKKLRLIVARSTSPTP